MRWKAVFDEHDFPSHANPERLSLEVFSHSDKGWSGYEAIEGLDQTLRLAAIDFEMALSEVYRDVLAG